MAQSQDNVEKVDVTDVLQLFKNGADTIYAAKSDLSGYVATETGKGLSSNDFTDSYKQKLDSVDTSTYLAKSDAVTIYAAKSDLSSKLDSNANAVSATKATQDGAGNIIASTYLTTSAAASTYLSKSDAQSTYVTIQSGKGLSSNDYTTTEKNKLAGISDNAQVNVIESVKVNNSALTVSNKAVNIDLANATVKSAASLNSSQYLKVSLNSTSAQSFNGSAAATVIGVGGTLPVAYGGTGATNLNNITVGTAVSVSGVQATSNAFRHVWFSDNTADAKRVYDDNFQYNPSTKSLKVGSISGTASNANSLSSAQSLKVSLNSTSAQSFNGSAAATVIGVGGTLPVANGGTGQTVLSAVTVGKANSLATAQSLKVSLNSTSAQSFNGSAAATVIGVGGTLPAAYGGTGVTDLNNITVGGANRDGQGNVIKDFYVSKSEFNILKNSVRFGIRIKKSEADPESRVEYIFDAAGMSPAKMDFTNGVFDYGSWQSVWFVRDNLPLMLNYDGSVAYYLDPNDYTKKVDGTASDVANTNFGGNAMAQIPLCWVKRYEDDDYLYQIIADRQVDDTYKAYAHTDSNGVIKPYCYNSLYLTKPVSGKLRSISGQTVNDSFSGNNAFTWATANGSGWYVGYWSLRQLIYSQLLLLAKNTTGLNDTFGLGVKNFSGTSATAPNNGTLNNNGQFWGANSKGSQLKVFHIEGFWGSKRLITTGAFTVSRTFYVKMTPPYNQNSTSNYSNTGLNSFSGEGYIKAMRCNDFGLIPITRGGSSTTYFADTASVGNGSRFMVDFGVGPAYGLLSDNPTSNSLTIWNCHLAYV